MKGKKDVAIILFQMVMFIAACSIINAADEPIKRFRERAFIAAHMAPAYASMGADFGGFAIPRNDPGLMIEQANTQAAGTQIGLTTFDYQSNCTMGRQVEHRGTNFLHFDWMSQTDFIYLSGDRGVNVEAYNLSTCALIFGDGGKRANINRAGYVTLDADIGGCAVPAAHENFEAEFHSVAYYDFCVSGPLGLFSSDMPASFYGYYQNSGTGPGNANLWPKIEWQVGTETVLHMVATESKENIGDPQTISYIRRVGPYGPVNSIWSVQRVIDTIQNIAPTITASATTDKVAIVWYAPCDYRRDQPSEFYDQYQNDIWYAVCDDQGQRWVTNPANGSIGHEVELGSISGDNITQYDQTGEWKAYCDLSALITSDENLHIVWSCRKWKDSTILYRRQSAIFHWSEDVPLIRPVVKAEWDTGGACFDQAWTSDVSKMSISECDGKLYVLYTQFGNAQAPCYDYGGFNNVLNGELYLTASDNNGLDWDRPQNLTNSITHLCSPGNCDSDHWASMARYGRLSACGDLAGQNVLDILYINDKTSGSVVNDDFGIWTSNPVMWLSTPCREVVGEPVYNDDADLAYGHCYGEDVFYVSKYSDTTLTITMDNTGTLENYFNISINYEDGSGWITPSAYTGVIGNGVENTTSIDFQITPPEGIPIPSIWKAEIRIDHDAPGSPRLIPICMLVNYNYNPPSSIDLATTCKRLRLWNTGELVDDSHGNALGYINDCDTFNLNTTSDVYLFDGSPIISRIDGSDTLRFMMYSKSYLEPDGMRQITQIIMDSSDSDYLMVRSDFITGDSTIGFSAFYYIPTAENYCDFIIEKLSFYSLSDFVYNNVLVGEILDWDIPSDSVVDNGSGYDLGRQMIYQYGAEYNQDDETEALCPQESDDRFGAIAFHSGTEIAGFKNAKTIDNETYIYTSGPYGFNAPLPPGPAYELMADNGYEVWMPSGAGLPYTDLSTLVTFGGYDLGPSGQCVIKILATTKDGFTDLEQIIDSANGFIETHGITCNLSCCDVPGDANDDKELNVGDAIYIINYIFKDGPRPSCIEKADSNGDGIVNSGDAVLIINYIFKDGPAPVCPEP